MNAVGGRLAAASRDPRDCRETSFLWQRISVLIQRLNAILIGRSTRPLATPNACF